MLKSIMVGFFVYFFFLFRRKVVEVLGDQGSIIIFPT